MSVGLWARSEAPGARWSAWPALLAVAWAMAACSGPAAPPAVSVASRAAPAATPASIGVLAVLPLETAVDDADARLFGDGMSVQLATALARVPGLGAISPESTFRFRGSSELNSVMGETLGASHLLRGSLRRQDGALELQLELVQTSDGGTLWSRHYQRVERELFGLQDEVVAAVVSALHAQPAAKRAQDERPPGRSLAAYEEVLRGDALVAQGDIFSTRQAVEAYQHALAIDPAYAHAHARLAQALIQQAVRFPLDEAGVRAATEQARRAAAAALKLAPDSAEAHQANAAWLGAVAGDPVAAMEEIRRALTLRPGDASLLAMLAVRQIGFGQLQDAAESLRQALRSNPLSAPTLYSLGSVYLGLADYPQAEHVLRQALELEPGLPLAQAFLAMAVFQQNRTPEAVEIARREPQALWRSYALAMVYWANAERARSDAELQVLIREHAGDAATQIAGVYAQRDDRDAMFHWLDVARQTGDPGLAEIRYMPFVSRYADDPRFIALARKLELEPAGPAASK